MHTRTACFRTLRNTHASAKPATTSWYAAGFDENEPRQILTVYTFACCSHPAGFDEDEEDEEDEGWGVVQAPFLPPPPSQPDAVEHWARAMFDQRGGTAGAGQPFYAAAGGAAAARGLSVVAMGSSPGSNAGGMMSMERIRSMFGRGE
jgi:hypothetical protein